MQGRTLFLGSHSDEEEAARACVPPARPREAAACSPRSGLADAPAPRSYDQVAISRGGSGAYTNFPLADYDVDTLVNTPLPTLVAELRGQAVRPRVEGQSSRYRGVCRHKQTGKWSARIQDRGAKVSRAQLPWYRWLQCASVLRCCSSLADCAIASLAAHAVLPGLVRHGGAGGRGFRKVRIASSPTSTVAAIACCSHLCWSHRREAAAIARGHSCSGSLEVEVPRTPRVPRKHYAVDDEEYEPDPDECARATPRPPTKRRTSSAGSPWARGDGCGAGTSSDMSAVHAALTLLHMAAAA